MSGLIYTVHVVGEDGVNTVAFGPDSKEIPAWALEKIGAHAFEDGKKPDVDDPDDPDDGQPYSKWLKADLQAEVTSRNEGRDEAAVVVVEGNGTVADLVAALEADDAASNED